MNKLNAENFYVMAGFIGHCLDSVQSEFNPILDSIEYENRFARMRIQVYVKIQGQFKDEIKDEFFSIPCKLQFDTLLTKKDIDNFDVKLPCHSRLYEIGDVKISQMSDNMRHESIRKMSNPFKNQKGGVYNETEEKETQSPKLLQNE